MTRSGADAPGDAPAPIDVREVSRVHRLSRRARRIALDRVSLRVKPGERVALLGPNGSGKSSLLRAMAWVDPPDTGEVRLFGLPAGAPAARARTGVVFQAPAIDRLLTVGENLTAAAALHGCPDAPGRARAAAARFGLAERWNERAGRLSGGLLRRADLARATLHEPDVLLLDEPTTGLDHRARIEFLGFLRPPGEGPGPAIVLATHLLDEAALAQRVVLMDAGRIVADGTPDELRARVGTRVVRWQGAPPGGARPPAGAVVLSDPGEAAALASELVRAGATVEAGPPSLAEVYLALTGRSLAGAASAGGEEGAP